MFWALVVLVGDYWFCLADCVLSYLVERGRCCVEGLALGVTLVLFRGVKAASLEVAPIANPNLHMVAVNPFWPGK